MADAALSHDDELAGIAAHAPVDERRCGTDKIRHFEYGCGTFGVRHDLRPRVGIPRIHQAPYREGGMHHTSALPDLHVFAAGLLLDVISKVPVGKKENGFFERDRIDYLNG